MSAAINPKRFWGVPDRPLSADPAAAATSSSNRFSSFSSALSSSISSAFGGRYSRSNSTSTQSSANPVRPASAAPQQAKWVPRPATLATANQSRSSRHRSTSSASAAAAALPSPAEGPLPPLPPDSRHRSSPAPPGEGADAGPDAWRTSIQRAAASRYKHRMRTAEQEFRERLRAARSPSSHRRDSISSGSSGSTGSLASNGEGHLSEEIRLRAQFEQLVARFKSQYEEEVRTGIREEARRRGVPPPLPSSNSSAPVLAPSRSRRERSRDHGVLDEDEADEWTWRPDGHGGKPIEAERSPDNEKWKEAVRQEQQVIWDAIKRTTTPSTTQLSSSASRKVHFAPGTPPSTDSSGDSNPPSATPLSASQMQPPSLPRTPHTSAGYPSHLSVRPLSAHPSVSSANRPFSPAVTAPGVRPGSARPSSPAYTRWIPSAGPTPAAAPNGLGGRPPSNPIAIPGRSSGAGFVDANGSAGKERTASIGANGSWRDWSTPGHPMRRDAPTPSPTATNGSAHGHVYPRIASNSNLHSSVYTTVQMHGRTPSSGNLQAIHGRAPSSGDLQSGIGLRRAVTPGVSSASAYARQRTASVTQRAPSVPPLLNGSAAREGGRDREYMYGKEYTSMRDRERRSKTMVVDDREPDEPNMRTQPPLFNVGDQMKRVQASEGLGSRQSSTRSALVDDDAPPPEAFSSIAPGAISLLKSSSTHSEKFRHNTKDGEEDRDEDDILVPPRRDKGKGKARAPPSPMLSSVPLPGTGRARRGSHGHTPGGMYAAQLEDFASTLRRDLGISTEA
ncbi:uncharacterized protein FOMMEDRAFT_139020 [Fomitiporia mediterranea MF3/22]|uniref:uncharacterized protein n=1 Tax=Fomitiporia mediterranea (strain MF3/22) TaxID=694068 RepID=UPI00044082C3|nr:uncharacterized protein FOMMEDRAFT_139020 [Fomitiporia mediterranea MF3/22]EJD05639.1 hypothetical protein FOMMEDRAFT_139020 [Fomitiporia mediterranea MF3/22]